MHNNGKADDRLLSVESPISDDAQLHEHAMSTSGAMKMQQVPNVVVPAGKDVMFAPGAYHVMLMQPKDRSLLSDGKRFPLTLHFERPATSPSKWPCRSRRRRTSRKLTNTRTDHLIPGTRHEPAAQQQPPYHPP